jgi:hypothetical protein
MKSVKYEGFYHCTHNHLTGICSLTFMRKNFRLLLKSRWMKNGKEKWEIANSLQDSSGKM